MGIESVKIMYGSCLLLISLAADMYRVKGAREVTPWSSKNEGGRKKGKRGYRISRDARTKESGRIDQRAEGAELIDKGVGARCGTVASVGVQDSSRQEETT